MLKTKRHDHTRLSGLTAEEDYDGEDSRRRCKSEMERKGREEVGKQS
jgi:hypothetical protein